MADVVRRTGQHRLIFKPDQEPSGLDLKNKVVAELGGSHDVIMEASPVNEHRSNGVDERAVQTNGGMVRTPRLEQSYSKEMEADHVVIPWLIMHRAEMVSLSEDGSDGSTANERSRGKPYRKELPFSVSACSTFHWDRKTKQREQAGSKVPQ